ncbi:LacI family transcriptional regulator [Mycetocola manganoxydans]|uniref:LacI family transcriptional regulator n=1 Tax=Mycetocola manganoxydans TaxID=699879 RepID=A0A3L6ZQQ3_9MICO|nr:LacI family DNA-binding transcriptional regulator [Mycetocola manganoxydans]RLP70236.1 LacI family transcriptional regulator [Mycetocola manganoxydans]GHD49441.1 LacI family transcriptional regulator [Mycetocola manganoxydans]
MATIYDVATLAGVSPATVSRVFNGRAVSEDRAQRVRDAAEALSFVPNRTARTLRRQSSEVIALIIPDIENPFFTALARAVEDRAQAAGYSVVLCNTDDDPVKEATYLQIAISENMAGVILVPASDESDLSTIIASGRPVVTVDRTTAFDVDHVMIENEPAGASVTAALFDAGYQRIACIAGPETVVTAIDRARGWRSVVERRGNYNPDLFVRSANHRLDGGRAAMAELLASPERPDAVVATNNLMGVGALQVLNEYGLTPPAFGVGVIGDLPFTTLSPGLVTLVHLPTRDLGTTAVGMLVSRISGHREPARTVLLPGELAAAASVRS